MIAGPLTIPLILLTVDVGELVSFSTWVCLVYGFFFGLTESASRCATQLRSDFSRKQLAKMALNGEVKLLAQSDPGWAARVVATDVRNNGTGRISERATALRPHPSKTARHQLAWLWGLQARRSW